MPHLTEFENTAQGMAMRWKTELEEASGNERSWRERSQEIIDRYRDEKSQQKRRYNILWANTETLKPQLYSQTPAPDVRRRFHQDDEVSREAAETLEKGLKFSLDSYDFDSSMEKAVFDYLLTGRGVARVRYVPTFQKEQDEMIPVQEQEDESRRKLIVNMEDGPKQIDPDDVEEIEGELFFRRQPEEKVTYEEVRCEYVNWQDFRLSPARTWDEVRWIAFRHRMKRHQLIETFGEIGKEIPLNFSPKKNNQDDSDKVHQMAEIWEIWNKENKEVIFISEGMDQPIDVRDDPLNLTGFFPVPEPLYSFPTNDTMIPIPEYTLYQDQAIELDNVTNRIDKLVDAMKVRGVYAGEHSDDISRIFSSDENDLIPIADAQAMTGNGKLQDMIEWVPIEPIAKALQWLYQQRDQLIQAIFQLTGISDIMRGSTDPRETQGAQQLKSQFGVQRLQPRQRNVQQFARNIIAMKAEIMAEMFDPQTLQTMTGIEQTKEITDLLRSDTLRQFRVDIETDSTIAAESQGEKQAITEMFQAMTGLLQQTVPAVQAGMISKDAAKEMLKFGLRRFKVSRQIEEAFDQPVQQQQQQPDPVEMAKVKNERMKIQIDAKDRKAKREIDLMKLKEEALQREDENTRHAIDTLLEQEKNDEQLFATSMEKLGELELSDEEQNESDSDSE